MNTIFAHTHANRRTEVHEEDRNNTQKNSSNNSVYCENGLIRIRYELFYKCVCAYLCVCAYMYIDTWIFRPHHMRPRSYLNSENHTINTSQKIHSAALTLYITHAAHMYIILYTYTDCILT